MRLFAYSIKRYKPANNRTNKNFIDSLAEDTIYLYETDIAYLPEKKISTELHLNSITPVKLTQSDKIVQ